MLPYDGSQVMFTARILPCYMGDPALSRWALRVLLAGAVRVPLLTVSEEAYSNYSVPTSRGEATRRRDPVRGGLGVDFSSLTSPGGWNVDAFSYS